MTSVTTLPLRRLFRVVNGGTPTADAGNWDGDVPWATPVDLGRVNGGLLGSTARTLTAAGLATGSRAVQARSLIVSTRAPIGYVAQVEQPTAFNQGCRGLEARAPVDIRFFRYQLSASTDRLASLGQGSTFIELSGDQLASFKIVCPPLDEQRVIADYLDRETARIDSLIAAKERMEHLVDQREFAVASYLAVPAGCRFVHLRYLATLQSGVTVDSGRNLGTDAVRRPYLRVANVQAGRLNLDEVTEISVPAAVAVRSTLRVGDVVMTEGGDIDKLGRGTVWNDEVPDCLHQNHIFAVRPDHAKLDADYLALLTMSAHARAYFESTGVQSTNLASTSASKIMSLPVPALSAQSQTRLVSEWKREAAHLGALRQALAHQIRLLREHRQALITAAVTGHIGAPVAA